MPRMTSNMHTSLPPENVPPMRTDFSARRLTLWKLIERSPPGPGMPA